jgi:flagellar biogenesis protein FliO
MPWTFWATYIAKLAIVGLVLAALYVVARKLRETRFFAHRAGRCVSVVESAMLSQHVAIHLLRAGNRYFLVGSASAAISVLVELAPEDLAPAGADPRR